MQRINVKNTVETAVISALICICSIIAIPSPIPITMQTFAVFFAIFYLGGKRASCAVMIYVAIGALGLPVFSGFTGGIGRLFDPIGGYITGFFVAALFFWLTEAFIKNQRAFKTAILSAVALAIIYITGTVQYVLLTDGTSAPAAVITCVIPFIIPDIIKISLAYAVGKRLKK